MRQPSRHPVISHHLPRQLTPFIGRSDDLAEIATLLADPACRLLTLVGPGGIGKTRLAIEAAAEKLDNATHGVYFVPLQSVRSSDFLVSAIMDAVKFFLSGREDPKVQLLNYLRDKEMLLLLDNFEQLLVPPSSSPEGEIQEGVDLLTDILNEAPGVRLLVTSREVLNLQEEWLYYVQGMPFPRSGRTDDFEAYSAVQLFVERARRVSRDFSPVEEGADVIRICQLVEGMPLAIELAASWTKSLPCEVIAAEIQRNIDFLTTSLRNVPDRQRSMRAVFDHSWRLLTQQEREAFKRLSVFRGSFHRQAAERVAGASLSTLSALVDKSLLRPEPDGCYQIHELLRQYGALQLAQSPEDVARVYDLHCAYYADFLHERRQDMIGGRQREATAEIKAELGNIRAAWGWAVELAKVEEIQKATQPLSWFYQFQSRYLEGLDAFERATQSLIREDATERTDLALVTLLVEQGWFYIRLGRLEQAEAALAQCRAIYRRLDIPPVPGEATDPLLPLGIIASIRGDYAAAAQLGEEARRVSEAHHHKGNLPYALYVLARASLAQGDYESARQYAQQACAVVEEVNDRWFKAYCLNELGNIAAALGDYAEARQHYQTSYALREALDDPEGMAVALNHLGKIAVLQENYAEANRLYERSVAIYQGINDKGGLATSLSGLGAVACALGDCQVAQQHFRQALEIAADIQFVPLILSLLIGIGELLLRTGQEERGLELLTLALHHPASEQETKERAQRGLDHYQASLSPDLFAAAVQRGQESDLEAVAEAVRAELAVSDTQMDVAPPGIGRDAPRLAQPLVEPLTPRELEVLQFIAQGLTNKQIAEELVIAVGTVKFYTAQIYGKLGVHSRTQAVAHARELELLS